MKDLVKKQCTPCVAGAVPLKGEYLAPYSKDLDEGWKIVDEHHLEKTYTFPNFKEALHFTNELGTIAEDEGHHPDLYLSWGKVKVLLWTHKINGLSENDFIMAAKSDVCYFSRKGRNP